MRIQRHRRSKRWLVTSLALVLVTLALGGVGASPAGPAGAQLAPQGDVNAHESLGSKGCSDARSTVPSSNVRARREISCSKLRLKLLS
jgi:hypothetical protein